MQFVRFDVEQQHPGYLFRTPGQGYFKVCTLGRPGNHHPHKRLIAQS
jgi:hypothetical protein